MIIRKKNNTLVGTGFVKKVTGSIEPITITENGVYGSLDLQQCEYIKTDGEHLVKIITYPYEGNYYIKKLVFAINGFVGASSADNCVVGCEDANIATNKFYFNIFSDNYYQYANAGSQGSKHAVGFSYELGNFYTLTTTISNDEHKLYLDGTLLNTHTSTSYKGTHNQQISIGGCDSYTRGEMWFSKVSIKELEIWDKNTDTCKFKLIPMKDKTSPRYFIYDQTNGVLYNAQYWTGGALVSGGFEYEPTQVDGYLPVTVNVEGRLYGVPTSELSKSTIDLSTFDVSNLSNISSYQFYYWFRERGINLPSVFETNSTTIGSYAFGYSFYGCKSAGNYIDVKIKNVTDIGQYAFQYAFYSNSTTTNQHIRDIEIGDEDHQTTLGTYAFTNAFYGYSNIRNIIVRGTKNITTSSVFYYAFRGATSGSSNCSIDGDISFPDLETINASSAFNYAFAYRHISRDTARVINPFPKLTDAKGSSVFSYAFQYGYTHTNSIFVFPKLKTFGQSTTASQASYMFQYCYGAWKYCWWLALETLGGDYATYSLFTYAWSGTKTDNCYQLCFPNLKHINSTSTSTSATYGMFNSCTLMSKIWLPQLQDITGYAQVNKLFNACTQSGLEIHFGKEHETYIKSLDGYASKFGATNATIYFDCVNHITVNGTVYDRSGEDYIVGTTNETSSSTHTFTHANDRYAWKSSGGAIVYTLECWTPAVGENVYDASDNVIGTIGGIA